MRHGVAKTVSIIGVAALGLLSFLIYELLTVADLDHWESEVVAFERRDVSNPPPRGAILFVGGRDIRYWETLEADLAPLLVMARGIGGAQIRHLTHYAARLIKPYEPAAVMIVAGGEDLADVHGRRPEDVLDDFKILVSALRAHEVEVPIYFISIKPSPMRAARWLGVKRANGLIEAYCGQDDRLHYVDVTRGMFDERGDIRDELFRWDGLTLNEAGYRQLTQMIRPVLISDFGADE